jgi:hypothetical protein
MDAKRAGIRQWARRAVARAGGRLDHRLIEATG